MHTRATITSFDYILVGGGLQNGLIALVLLARRPGVRIAMIERGARLGGNHTWCYHSDDVAPPARQLVDPLVAHRWPGYSVHFPARERVVPSPYAAVTSERLHAVVSSRLAAAPGCSAYLGWTAVDVRADAVTLTPTSGNGERHTLHARMVIDARGPDAGESYQGAGYQKFLGHEVELDAPHRLARPVLIDATVLQGEDGYRFFYVLPLSPTRLLIEETYYSDTAALAMDQLRANVAAYATSRGYRIREVIREESGVLPIPWGSLPQPVLRAPLVAGYRGGFFHPTTGYSFPVATRLAELVAATAPEALIGPELAALARTHRGQIRFCSLLNKMLFLWYPPAQRYRVLEHFYRLPEATIRRFYALTMTRGDYARILTGRPPRGLSVRAALASGSLLLSPRHWTARAR